MLLLHSSKSREWDRDQLVCVLEAIINGAVVSVSAIHDAKAFALNEGDNGRTNRNVKHAAAAAAGNAAGQAICLFADELEAVNNQRFVLLIAQFSQDFLAASEASVDGKPYSWPDASDYANKLVDVLFGDRFYDPVNT